MGAVTEKAVEERLAGLKEQYAKCLNDANAYHGAIQDCEFWLAELRKPDPEPTVKAEAESEAAERNGEHAE